MKTFRLLPLLLCVPVFAQVNVLMYHNDAQGTGQNLAETILTPATAGSSQFGRLFSYTVDGYVYAQPLYVSALAIPGKGVHDVVFVATEHDSVYAFDANGTAGGTANLLWHVGFIDAAAGITTVPFADAFNCSQIVPEIGITGTPVIDLASGTMYVVAMTKEPGPQYVHRLHALDIATGAEKPGSPVAIQASVPGTGDRTTSVNFVPRNYKERPGLALLNGVVYTSWSSHCDAGTYHGWIMGYDARTLQQVTVYNSTPNGSQASFWASGAAPTFDAAGNLYVISGNGTFDADTGGPDLGESFIKLSTAGGLRIADYFAPFNQANLNSRDLDTGSSGALLLPDSAGSAAHPHLLVSAGKEGRIYVLDRDNMGHFQAGSDSQIVQSLTGQIGALFSMPAYFNGSVYFAGSGDALKAFAIANGQLGGSPSSQSSARFGSPGAVPSVSANGAANGIVWVIEPAARLHAYDASNLARELFSGATGTYVKFSAPTIANGKVYVGTQNSLLVFGLSTPPPAAISAVVNAASFQAGRIAPGSIVTIFGSNLAQGTASATDIPLPTSLGGASLTINGVAAPLFYASATQINAQVPGETAIGQATAVLTIAGNSAPAVTFPVQAAAPGIFQFGQNRAVAQNADGSVNDANRPAAAGSIITAYLTGQGKLDSTTAATIGGQAAEVTFAGPAPGFEGLFQVNLKVPSLAAGNYALVVTVSGVASNSALVTLR